MGIDFDSFSFQVVHGEIVLLRRLHFIDHVVVDVVVVGGSTTCGRRVVRLHIVVGSFDYVVIGCFGRVVVGCFDRVVVVGFEQVVVGCFDQVVAGCFNQMVVVGFDQVVVGGID